MPETSIIKDLNPPQKEAVTYEEGPLLVLAGAGSGKTKVLTRRAAYLIIHKKVSPDRIIAMTFTNKAAAEMKERIFRLTKAKADGIWMGTFHALCARVLRKHATKLGYTSAYTICDEKDRKNLIQEILKEFSQGKNQIEPKIIMREISRYKNYLIPWDEIEIKDAFSEIVAQIYEIYQNTLKKNNAMDFDDLLFNTVLLFEENQKVKDIYAEKFLHILVDEFQDTNYAQYKILNHLAEKHRNIMVVGDDDQSIYGFRGAELGNIMNFENDFEGTKIIKLEQNYRSTKNILAAALSVVKNNKKRKGKILKTDKPKGEKLTFFWGYDPRNEAEKVVKKIFEEKKKGKENKDFVILYRINAQSRAIEEMLRRHNLPYKIVGGMKFYERKEIKDIFAYLKAALNSSDRISYERLLNLISGVGKKTFEKIEEYGKDHDMSFGKALMNVKKVPNLTPSQQRKIYELSKIIKTIQKNTDNVYNAVNIIIEKTGYMKNLSNAGDKLSKEKVENIKELVSSIENFVMKNEDKSCENYIREVALYSDVDDWTLNNEITLMTIHNAKGLEFPVVFLIGLNEHLFPHYLSVEEDNVEEERRLFYVALTRAKEKVYLSATCGRESLTGFLKRKPSPFLREIPKKYISGFELLEERSEREEKEVVKKEGFNPGDYVIHSVFGRGRIISVEGSGEREKAKINFSNEVKVIRTSFLKKDDKK